MNKNVGGDVSVSLIESISMKLSEYEHECEYKFKYELE